MHRQESQPVFLGAYSKPGATLGDFNDADLAYPGSLGVTWRVGDKWYQLVKVSATAAAPAPAQGLVAFWKDKDNFVVTSKIADSFAGTYDNSRNYVAGVFLGTITAGNYCVIQKDGVYATVLASGTCNVGDIAYANTNTSADVIAQATTPPYLPMGIFRTTQLSSRAAVELMLRTR